MTSGGYGFAVERSIAYAYLPPDRAAIGTRGEVEVFGEWVGFEVAREPLYDPAGARIRVVSGEPDFGPDWSASLRRGTDAELRGWLEVALAACDEADVIARAHFRRDLEIDDQARPHRS